MRVMGPTGQSQVGTPSTVKPSGGSGAAFASHMSGETPSVSFSARTSATRAASGVDALFAVHALESDVREKRRKAVKKGREALDILDELKMDMLAGQLNPALMLRLTSARGQLQERSGDRPLDDLLDAIETRAAVELAKLEVASRR